MSLLSPPLQAFVAIAQLKSVHSASRQLGLTQTAVTQRLRALEQSLSSTLFTRSRKGMMLTHEGQALLRYCQATQELEGQALALIQGAAQASEIQVTLSGPTSFMRTRVIPACTTVLQKHPELLLAFDLHDSDARLEQLKGGTSQLTLLAPEQVGRELDSKLLRPEKYVLVGPRRWRGRSLQNILKNERIIDFDSEDRMTRAYLKHFGLLQDAREGRHFVNNTEAMCELTASGMGYGVLTEEFAAPWIQRGALIPLNQGRVLPQRWALAWYPRPQMPSYFKNLIDAIR